MNTKKELALKLVEQANEFLEDRNIQELADVIEVFNAILKAYGFSREGLETFRAKKNRVVELSMIGYFWRV